MVTKLNAVNPWVPFEVTPEVEAMWDRIDAEDAAEAAQRAEDDRLAPQRRREAHIASFAKRMRDDIREAMVTGTLEARQALTEARAWFETRAKTSCLILSGQSGCGKTVAAQALIAAHGGLWLDKNDAIKAFTGYFGEAAERVVAAVDAPLLVIDDVGTEDDPKRMTNILIELFDKRMSAKLSPWVITTNSTHREFADRYQSARLRGRLRQDAEWIALTDQDMRRKKG